MNRLRKHAHSASWIIMVALLTLWGFGVLTVGNRSIHLLLVVALVILAVQLIGGRLKPR